MPSIRTLTAETPPGTIEFQEPAPAPQAVQVPVQPTPAMDSPAQSSDAAPAAGLAPAAVVPAAPASPGWLDSLSQSVRQPQIVVLLSLLIAGTFFLAKGYRRARPFAMLVAVGFLGFYVGGCPCPVGSLQNTVLYLGDVAGHVTAYVQLGAVMVVTLLFGRVFCGWGCPLGATQFFLFRKERSGKNRWLEIPRGQHNVLRLAKYGVLLALVGLVIVTGQPVFEQVDPFRVLFNLDFRWGLPLVFLIALVVASVVIGFPFCKYLCPLGAFLGLLQRLSIFKLRFSGSCTNCNLCSSVSCDYGAIEPGTMHPTINQMECVRCGECASRCPHGAISLSAGRQ